MADESWLPLLLVQDCPVGVATVVAHSEDPPPHQPFVLNHPDLRARRYTCVNFLI